MRNISICLLLVSSLLLAGCATQRPLVLTDSEAYYLVPAGTPFKAVVVKGGAMTDVTRDADSYNVSAGLLVKLQEEANHNVLGK